MNNIKKIVGILLYYIINLLGIFIKKNDNYIVIGSWQGKNYTDNPRYLMEYMLSNTEDYIFIWIGDKSVQRQLPQNIRVKFCKINTLKSIYYVLKSKYAIFSQGMSDIFNLNIYRNMTTIFLDHGIPVKKWALDDQRLNVGLLPSNNLVTRIYKKFTKSEIQYDYFISASKLNDECILSALANLGPNKENILKSGTPRNDVLIRRNEEEIINIKNKYAQMLKFDPGKKVVLYAPTFRRTNSRIEVLCDRNEKDKNILRNILKKNNAVLIEKNHFATFNNNLIDEVKDNCFIKVDNNQNKYINIQEILLFTDILISDYSGVFLDYCLLDKPIIHFAFDYEYYRDIDSGLYYDINDFAAGKVTKNFEETCEEINNLLKGNDEYSDRRNIVRRTFLEYEDGSASEKIVKKVFKK